MKKSIILGLLCAVLTVASFAQSNMKLQMSADSTKMMKKSQSPFTVDVTASIKNMHYWRGYAVGPSPLVTAMASVKHKSGLEIGTWNGLAFDGGFKDVDTYVAFSKGGFSASVWDVFNFSDYNISSGSFPYGNYGNSDYFDYSKTSRHFIDASIGYDVPKTSLSFYYATIIYGRDRNPDGSSRFSSYFKTSYGFKTETGISITPYASFGWAYNSKNGGTFWQWTSNATSKANLNEIGFDFKKKIKITDSYSVTANAGIVASPVNKTITGLFGITLF